MTPDDRKAGQAVWPALVALLGGAARCRRRADRRTPRRGRGRPGARRRSPTSIRPSGRCRATGAPRRWLRRCCWSRPCSGSRFTAVYILHGNTQLLGMAIGRHAGAAGRGGDRRRQVRRAPGDAHRAARAAAGRGAGRRGRADDRARRGGDLPPGAAGRRGRRGRRGAGHRRRHSAGLAGAEAAGDPRHAVAAGSPAGRRRRAVRMRRPTSRSARSTPRCPRGAMPRSSGRGCWWCGWPGSTCSFPPARRGWAPEGILGLLEDLPARRVRDLAVPLPDVSADERRPGVHLPVPLLDVLPGEGGRLIFGPAGRALPQLPLMIDDQGYLRAAGPFNEDIGPSWWNVHRARVVSLLGRMLHRRLVRVVRWNEQRVGAATGIKCGAALRVSRPLVVPARRDRPVRVPRAGRHRDLPDALLHPGRLAGHLPRLLRAAAGQQMSEAYRSVLDLSLQRPRRPADAPGPPLGGRRVHRLDRAAPVRGSSSPAPTASRAISTTTSACRC